MRLKSIGVLRGYAMGKTQLSKITDNIEREVEEALESERSKNAKLRELLSDAWGYINHPCNATWTHKKRKEVRDSIGDRMRELGLEVDR